MNDEVTGQPQMDCIARCKFCTPLPHSTGQVLDGGQHLLTMGTKIITKKNVMIILLIGLTS
jgi:hypothetical protein